ncbi:MAG: fused MFS/spermidine synthase [Thermoanaerobaculia bacterium]
MRTWKVAALLLGSGLCSLVYQMVWLRQFRLIFGGSTAASSAVIAIFLAGLGFGGLWLGRRADRAKNPLAMYGWLEVGIASSAALSPLLLLLAEKVYFGFGGSFSLGPAVTATVRLLLACVVIGLPTFLMGGTLPAAARAVETREDKRRYRVALLYGLNTFGAVTGVFLATFYALEHIGNRYTLWMAALLNLFVALTALLISRSAAAQATEPSVAEAEASEESLEPRPVSAAPLPAAERRFVYVAAGAVGFVFLLMEIVWYRMLAPLLGGTTYTFGLILAMALLGVAIGSTIYTVSGNRRATWAGLALTCTLEALLLIAPFAAGDTIASVALMLRPMGSLGFGGFVASWVLVTALVVLAPAAVAGYQFPMLISLLGEGSDAVGHDVGKTYAANTVGTILGSIAGGFGLLPALTATGCWRLAAALLVATGAAAAFFGARRSVLSLAPAAVAAVIAVPMLFAAGPTAFWRHSPIGAGRVQQSIVASENGLRAFQHERRRSIVWQADGVESSVGLAADDGYAFIVSGKSDGHSRQDAGTQIMGGILGAMLHPNPKTVAVIGLGTGTTAGWVADVPSVERVDVVEIERAIRHVAEVCAPVNRGALENPKVVIHYGDGREFLLTNRKAKFDLISSEPSNPYRAGVASLFTVDFYAAAAGRLEDKGLFMQFLQAYEIDGKTLKSIYASLSAVFPYVQTWQTQRSDLLLVASMSPIELDGDALREKVGREPYRSALWNAWRVASLEGFLARYVAGAETSKSFASGAQPNTDDRTIIEYSFAKMLGRGGIDVDAIRAVAMEAGEYGPPARGFDAGAVEDERLFMPVAEKAQPMSPASVDDERQMRGLAAYHFAMGNYADVFQLWVGQSRKPGTPLEILSFAEALAATGNEQAGEYVEKVRERQPTEAKVIEARMLIARGQVDAAVSSLVGAFEAYRTDPWPLPIIMERGIDLAVEIARRAPLAEKQRLFAALEQPFALRLLDDRRKFARLSIADQFAPGQCGAQYVAVLRGFEPDVPWQPAILKSRVDCYEKVGDKRAAQARADLLRHQRAESEPLVRR